MIPPDAALVLGNAHCAHQGFAQGKHLALQCHVEMTEKMVKEWCEIGIDEVQSSQTSPAVETPQQMQRDLPERIKKLIPMQQPSMATGYWGYDDKQSSGPLSSVVKTTIVQPNTARQPSTRYPSMPSPTPTTDPELKQLENALASPAFKGKALSLDRLQGFLCAVASSPDTILPSKWLPDALGGSPDFESMEQAQEVMGLLMRFYNEVTKTLHDGLPLKLILKPRSATDPDPDYQAWCEGYILGWALSTQEWLRPGNEALKKLTFPILFLSGAFREDAQSRGKTYIPDEDDVKMQQECAETLPGAVATIHNFFLAQRKTGPIPIKREAPKVGRNVPCPCGSGKKFKQCCGGEKILH